MSESLLVKTKKQCLEAFGGHRFNLRRLCKSIRRDLMKKIQLEKKDDRKIQHLQQQLATKKVQRNLPRHQPTVVPERLSDYSSLSIFRSPKDMPNPQAPLGPFLCSPYFKLSHGERQILSKDPKYSLMMKCNSTDCTVENERMMSKHRYNENMKKNCLINQVINWTMMQAITQSVNLNY